MNKEQLFEEIDEIYSEWHGGELHIGTKRTERIKEALNRAINFIPCCTQLKAVDKLGYTQWKDKIGLIKDVDKGLYKLKGNYITINEVLDMFEVYCDSF